MKTQDEIRAYRKQWRINNKEKTAQYIKKWRDENREAYNKYMREYQAKKAKQRMIFEKNGGINDGIS